ncbi:uncharacterized protein PAC_19690 [Phialocephala subalpina]|uniref:Uncharacterized protein n=1 Tax=Phialocephala subalpina TaxID=576137 RepID=A0A1L7XXQ1_9HELO|nr:uncharacterized protein PAC_19690 [Phialocephala subalpina]
MAWSDTIKALKAPGAPLGRLAVTLAVVKAKLEPKKGLEKAYATLKWPFDEKKVDKIIFTINHENILLGLALANDSRKLIQGINRSAKQNGQQLAELVEAINQASMENQDQLTDLKNGIANVESSQSRLQDGLHRLHNLQGDRKAAEECKSTLDWLTPIDYAPQQSDFISRRSSLPNQVKALYDQHKTKRTRPSFKEISQTLQSVAARFSRVFVIVDALDECQVSECCRARFLAEIFNLRSESGVNVFATSRFIPEITENFKDREIITFLLAQVYFGSLDDKLTPKTIKCALKQFQKQSQEFSQEFKVQVLGLAYDQTMERVNGQKAGLKELAKQVLSWITFAKRELTIIELQHALAVEFGEVELDRDNIPQIKDIVSLCAGLVTIDEESNIIRLIHYTAQEYFERTKSHWFPNVEDRITSICVTYLSFSVFNSGYCRSDDEFEERLQVNPLYDYASHNWGHHARKASTLVQEALDFLSCDAKAQASSQALMAIKRHSSHSGYSQEFPARMIGIHLAAYFGDEEAVKWLLQRGAQIDSKDRYSRTPLNYAAANGYEAVVKLLIDKGASLEVKDIRRAAKNGHATVFKLLLDKGADLGEDDLFPFMEFWGLEVSLCTGNARRVRLKDLIQEPFFSLHRRS